MGNRAKYQSHVEPRLTTILAWRRRGLTTLEIAKNLGVSLSSLMLYQVDHPELSEALKLGKSDADAQVENALTKSAIGYKYEEVKTIIVRKPVKGEKLTLEDAKVKTDKTIDEIRIEKTVKECAPHPTSAIFYLTNRCSDRWRHKSVLEHAGPDGEPLQPGVIQIYLPEKKPVETKPGANAT